MGIACREEMVMSEGWIDEELFQKIRESMPLASVDLLVVHGGRLLLMRRLNEPGRGVWFLPGGRIRYGETLREAVLRELEEETGLTPTRIEAKGSMSHIWPDAHYVTTFFRIDVEDDDVRINPEHGEYMWVEELPDDVHPFVIEMVERAGIFE